MFKTLNQNKVFETLKNLASAKTSLVSKQKGGNGIGIEFLENPALKRGRFNDISLYTAPKALIVAACNSGLYSNGVRGDRYVIYVGFKKDAQITMKQTSEQPSVEMAVWESLGINASTGFGWSNPYQLEALTFSIKNGKEQIKIVGSDEKEKTEFTITTNIGSTLGIADLELKRIDTPIKSELMTGANIYQVNNRGYAWLPFPLNQSENVLLL